MSCPICDESYTGDLSVHEKSSLLHRKTVTAWRRDLWRCPNDYSWTHNAVKAQFLKENRRKIEPGITLWEIENHYFVSELRKFAATTEGYGLTVAKLKGSKIKQAIFTKVNEGKDLTELKGIPDEDANKKVRVTPPESNREGKVNDKGTVRRKKRIREPFSDQQHGPFNANASLEERLSSQYYSFVEKVDDWHAMMVAAIEKIS